jgi:hypothetical protein
MQDCKWLYIIFPTTMIYLMRGSTPLFFLYLQSKVLFPSLIQSLRLMKRFLDTDKLAQKSNNPEAVSRIFHCSTPL